jgi:hypothetical protein
MLLSVVFVHYKSSFQQKQLSLGKIYVADKKDTFDEL